jgi:hypothetical protein
MGHIAVDVSKLRRVTSQEPHTQQIVDPDVPDTEVILVAQPAPVFVDSTGRRRRLLRRFAYGFGAFCMVYGGLISLSLAGGPVSPSAVLPFPDLMQGGAGEPSIGRPLQPTPAPIVTAPKSVLVNDATPRRAGSAESWNGGSAATNRATARPTRATSPTLKPTPTSTARPVEGSPTTTKAPTTGPTKTVAPTADPTPTVSLGGTTSPGTGGGGGGLGSDDGDTDGGAGAGDPDQPPADGDPAEPGPDLGGPVGLPDDADDGNTGGDSSGGTGGSSSNCPGAVMIPSGEIDQDGTHDGYDEGQDWDTWDGYDSDGDTGDGADPVDGLPPTDAAFEAAARIAEYVGTTDEDAADSDGEGSWEPAETDDPWDSSEDPL